MTNVKLMILTCIYRLNSCASHVDLVYANNVLSLRVMLCFMIQTKINIDKLHHEMYSAQLTECAMPNMTRNSLTARTGQVFLRA